MILAGNKAWNSRPYLNWNDNVNINHNINIYIQLYQLYFVIINTLKGLNMSTLNDVAKIAKVSPITISRVINTPEIVKEKTRIRVLKAMEEVHYTPNPAAKALISKKTGIIDVYIPESIDLSNPFVIHFVGGISEALSKHMYSFMILRNRNCEHKCDGYIVTGLQRDEITEMYQYAKDRKRPIVLFGHTDIDDIDCIDVDNKAGIREITNYVLDKGHKNIRMINVNENKNYIDDRYEGYCLALKDHNIESNNEMILSVNSVEGGYLATQKILKDRSITAIICATDDLAIGAIKAVSDAGLRVPEDVTITGFDGLGHHLLSRPLISTVEQPIYEIGEMLADVLVKKINGNTQRTYQFIPPKLLVQESIVECYKI